MNRKKPIDHGTRNGYAAHKRRKEEACAPCKAAWATYYRDRRDQGRA